MTYYEQFDPCVNYDAEDEEYRNEDSDRQKQNDNELRTEGGE